MEIIAGAVAFAIGCLVSLKFWFGVSLGCFVPAVKRGLVRLYRWALGAR